MKRKQPTTYDDNLHGQTSPDILKINRIEHKYLVLIQTNQLKTSNVFSEVGIKLTTY